ncbi:MAG: fused DSP-PTPase phosphatase/NAD kinase-like protein [Sarcina sp.]
MKLAKSSILLSIAMMAAMSVQVMASNVTTEKPETKRVEINADEKAEQNKGEETKAGEKADKDKKEEGNLENNAKTEKLVFDHFNHNEFPANFRSTKLSVKSLCVNKKGLENLNISGSQQYSQDNLKLLKEKLPKKNLYFIDLRQESHGFINGLPISWEANGNKANMGLSREQVIELNNKQLNDIRKNEPIKIDNKEITPNEVIDEQGLIERNKDHYIRVTVTDTKLPAPEMVDFFVESVHKLPKNAWLHFHCKEGIGRTTTFMTMYDMMKNAKDVPMQDIIDRQIKMANLEKDEASLESSSREELYKYFYEYCKQGDFKKPFSKFAPCYKGNN